MSATTFTLIGVMNKCLTILINLCIWDKHAPAGGIASLALCLVGGAMYQQAPMRAVQTANGKVVAASNEDVWETELSGADNDQDEEEPLIVHDGMKLRK